MLTIEERKKDKILQILNDELEMQNWGDGYDKVTIRVTFRGKFEMMPLEVEQKQRRKPLL